MDCTWVCPFSFFCSAHLLWMSECIRFHPCQSKIPGFVCHFPLCRRLFILVKPSSEQSTLLHQLHLFGNLKAGGEENTYTQKRFQKRVLPWTRRIPSFLPVSAVVYQSNSDNFRKRQNSVGFCHGGQLNTQPIGFILYPYSQNLIYIYYYDTTST